MSTSAFWTNVATFSRFPCQTVLHRARATDIDATSNFQTGFPFSLSRPVPGSGNAFQSASATMASATADRRNSASFSFPGVPIPSNIHAPAYMKRDRRPSSPSADIKESAPGSTHSATTPSKPQASLDASTFDFRGMILALHDFAESATALGSQLAGQVEQQSTSAMTSASSLSHSSLSNDNGGSVSPSGPLDTKSISAMQVRTFIFLFTGMKSREC